MAVESEMAVSPLSVCESMKNSQTPIRQLQIMSVDKCCCRYFRATNHEKFLYIHVDCRTLLAEQDVISMCTLETENGNATTKNLN